MAGPRKLPWTFTHLFKIQQYSLFCMCNCSTTILYLKVHSLLPKLTAVHLINTTKHAELHWKWTSNRCGPAKDNKTCQLAKNSLLMCCALSTFLWKMLRMENLLIWIIWRALSGTINSALKVLWHTMCPCITLVLWNIAILRTFGVKEVVYKWSWNLENIGQFLVNHRDSLTATNQTVPGSLII